METATGQSANLIKQNPPAIFLQYGNPACIAVSSAVTFGITPKESSFLTASVAKVVLEAIDQPPLDGSIVSQALYEFSKKTVKIKEVIAVTYEKEKEVIRLWTFIEKRDKQVRRTIYKGELELMDSFPNLVFDFDVVSIERLKTKPLIPSDLQGYLVFYRKSQSGY